MSEKLHVAILWHMHQPPYEAPDTGKIVLPWVRLHAQKDYYDMALAVQRHAKMKCTFNFVPCLLDQLEQVAQSTYEDRFTQLSRPLPHTLSPEQRHNAAKELFSVHYPTMIHPFPRFRELWEKRQNSTNQNDFSVLFTDDELLDLQMWFELAWSGPTLRKDPDVEQLINKGVGFSQDDKEFLSAKQREVCRGIVPMLQNLSERGQIELSTSPYYHPILPLVVDTNIAKVANNNTKLPRKRFNYPADARNQILRAIQAHNHRFSRLPMGMWPSEGAISDTVLAMFAQQRISWVATDEHILWKSLPDPIPTVDWLCRPWKSHGVALFFRHRQLSDRIGFTYSQWDPAYAVADFVKHLHEIRKQSTLADPIVTIALDGENAWEYFPDGAIGFINGLYDVLSTDLRLIPTTFSEYLSKPLQDSFKSLLHVAPGSWIDGNLNTWIGDDHKNVAWSMLAEARRCFDDVCSTYNELLPPNLEEAYELLLRAEASDWFWWLGDGHTSAHDAEFDQLFRSTLIQIYRLLRLPAPPTLFFSIASADSAQDFAHPLHFTRPEINGRYDRFYDWRGCPLVTAHQGAIHQHYTRVSTIQVAIGTTGLYLRLTGNRPASEWFSFPITQLVINFQQPVLFRVHITRDIAHIEHNSAHAESDLQHPLTFLDNKLQHAIDDTLDVEIPWVFFTPASLNSGFPVEWYLEWLGANAPIERFPVSGNLSIHISGEENIRTDWIV
ncbi:MAG: hypothetical protein HUU55_13265 [Myxococcales bacterium]|nr:hypothetical protein [Myxococcales bacterium]